MKSIVIVEITKRNESSSAAQFIEGMNICVTSVSYQRRKDVTLLAWM